MTNRRNAFHAAWAAIAGLFCGGAQAALDEQADSDWYDEWVSLSDGEYYLIDGYIIELYPRADGEGWDSICSTMACFAGGDTKEQALEHTRDSLAFTVEWMLDEGIDLPPPDAEAKRLDSFWPLVETDMVAKCELPTRVAVPAPDEVNEWLRRRPHMMPIVKRVCTDAARLADADIALELERYTDPECGHENLTLYLRSAADEDATWERVYGACEAIRNPCDDAAYRHYPDEVFVTTDFQPPKGSNT